MRSFLLRFKAVVLGVLSGFDRLVFKGRLPQLYSPEGMNCYAAANHVRRLDFKKHAKDVTRQVLAASLMQEAKRTGRYQYLPSSQTSKEEVARAIWKQHPTNEGLVALLHCVEPCWTFDTKSVGGRLTIQGEFGKGAAFAGRANRGCPARCFKLGACKKVRRAAEAIQRGKRRADGKP